MKFEWNFRLTKLSKWLLISLAVVVVAAIGYFGYEKFYKKTPAKEVKADHDVALYTLVQSGKAKLVVYDPETKKHSVLFSIDWDDKDFGNFYANYSAERNQIVFSDQNGISLYDLNTLDKKRILENVKGTGPESMGGKRYSDPKWAQQGSSIVYKVLGYESMAYAIMNADGSNRRDIEGEGYALAWNGDGTRYAIASSAGMGTSSGLNVSLADPITKTRQVLAEKDLRDMDSLVWLDKIYFSGAKPTDGNQAYTISSVGADGTSLVDLDKDEFDNKSLISDGTTLYYSKLIHGEWPQKGSGIYSIKTDGSGKEIFYQDGSNQIIPQYANDGFVEAVSTTGQTDKSMRSLLLINKSDKQATLVGEAYKIDFAGFLKSNVLPTVLKEISTPTPTDEEKAALADSLKTRGSLYASFYDYCWDYDCAAATYPYAKMTASKFPEVVELSQKPNLLTGKVTVPVVFLYDSTPFTDEQIASLKNADLVSSYGYFEKWMNSQAKAADVSLNFSLDYKTNQIQMPDECISTQGSTRLLDQKCLSSNIQKTYPGLTNKVILAAIARSDQKNYTYYVNYNFSSEGTIVYTTFSAYYLTRPIAEFNETFTKEYNGFNYYNAKQMLAQYGAKDKVASYKKAADDAKSLCYIDQRDDVMCGAYLQDASKGTYGYIKLSEAQITEVTRKELGWYDADKNGTLEVDQKCPFGNSKNCN